MSMDLHERINAFEILGKVLGNMDVGAFNAKAKKKFDLYGLENAIQKSILNNKWFTNESIHAAFSGIAQMIGGDNLYQWIHNYDILQISSPKTVAVIMAGNIPVVGFHDFLCVLVSGHIFCGKLSSDDPFLLPAIAGLLVQIEPRFSNFIRFTEAKLDRFDAVIATGSNNSARYFDYYFGKYPHIIRRNRNSIAILNGDETQAEIMALSDDIFKFYGLGCRNVSKVFLPSGFDIAKLFEGFTNYEHVKNHSGYFNNYEYNRAIFLINSTPHLDNGFLILRQDHSLASPVSVLHYDFYESKEYLSDEIGSNKEYLQCIVSKNGDWPDSIPFGQAQYPRLVDYADGVDTMQFLLELSQYE